MLVATLAAVLSVPMRTVSVTPHHVAGRVFMLLAAHQLVHEFVYRMVFLVVVLVGGDIIITRTIQRDVVERTVRVALLRAREAGKNVVFVRE